MANDFLLRFLTNRLFTIRSGDDALLGKLRAAVPAVVEMLSDDPRLIFSFTSAALNPNTPPEAPVFRRVADAVQAQWQTYTEIFPEPRTVFRAILLDSLNQACDEDHNIAGSFDLLARNIFPFIQSGGEAPLLADFRDRIRGITHAEAEGAWPTKSSAFSFEAPSFSFGEISGSEVTISRDALREGLTHQFSGNWNVDDQSLFQTFYNKGMENIASVIEAAVKAGGVSSDALKTVLADPLNEGLRSLSKAVSQTMRSALASVGTLQKQMDLIWWKESGYSEVAGLPYREVPGAVLALAYAIDFGSHLPEFNPLAVEHFLAEVMVARTSTTGKAKALSAHLELFAKDALGRKLFKSVPLSDDISLDSTLIKFMRDLSEEKAAISDLQARTGIPGSNAISQSGLAVHLLRELQAIRLVRAAEEGAAR